MPALLWCLPASAFLSQRLASDRVIHSQTPAERQNLHSGTLTPFLQRDSGPLLMTHGSCHTQFKTQAGNCLEIRAREPFHPENLHGGGKTLPAQTSLEACSSGLANKPV